MITRRELLTSAAALAGAAALPHTASAQEHAAHPSAKPKPADGKTEPPAWTRPPHPEPGEPGKHYTPTDTLNGSTLPWKLVDGVKVFHLTCEEVRDHEFAPGCAACSCALAVWGSAAAPARAAAPVRSSRRVIMVFPFVEIPSLR